MSTYPACLAPLRDYMRHCRDTDTEPTAAQFVQCAKYVERNDMYALLQYIGQRVSGAHGVDYDVRIYVSDFTTHADFMQSAFGSLAKYNCVGRFGRVLYEQLEALLSQPSAAERAALTHSSPAVFAQPAFASAPPQPYAYTSGHYAPPLEQRVAAFEQRLAASDAAWARMASYVQSSREERQRMSAKLEALETALAELRQQHTPGAGESPLSAAGPLPAGDNSCSYFASRDALAPGDDGSDLPSLTHVSPPRAPPAVTTGCADTDVWHPSAHELQNVSMCMCSAVDSVLSYASAYPHLAGVLDQLKARSYNGITPGARADIALELLRGQQVTRTELRNALTRAGNKRAASYVL